MALKVWLPLNGNLNNQGLSPAKAEAVTTASFSDGKIGQSLSGGKIKIPAEYVGDIFNNEHMSICFWYYTNTDATTGNHSICGFSGNGEGDSGASRSWDFFAYSIPTTFHWSMGTIGGGSLANVLPNNQWVHIAVTFDGSKLLIYFNGVLQHTGSGSSNFTFDKSYYISFGSTLQKLNDFRIYDEVLSPKQIKEISKGLVAHYKLDNPYIETASNLAPGINGTTSYSINTSPAWDTELNGTPMINPSGWGNGYNGGVTDPTHGYHAHWVRENGQWLMMFPNLNSVISQKGRWEGISSGVSTKDILAGEKYTISWWQKTDNLNLAAWGGIYYKKTSDGTMNFWDSCPTLGYNTKLNTWQFMYKTFTRSSEYVQHDGGQSIYVYGGNSNEGTMYVKDVQIVRGDHPLPYAVGTKNNQSYESDCSGNGYTAKVTGSLSFNSDSARYDGSTKFDGSTGYLALGRPMPKDALTVNVWAYMDNWANYNGRIASCTEGGGWNFEPMSGGMNFALGVGANSNVYMNNFTSTQVPLSGISAGWHMFTGTFDGIYKKLYIDGVLKGSTNECQNGTTLTTATPIFYNGGNGVFIGAEAAGSQTTAIAPFFNGSISDFRIYATALSIDDILTIYKNSGIIDNKGNVYAYEFKEE